MLTLRKASDAPVSNDQKKESRLDARGQKHFGDSNLREIDNKVVVHKDDARYSEFKNKK